MTKSTTHGLECTSPDEASIELFAYPKMCRCNDSTRSQAVARRADRTAKNCRGHVT